MFVRKLNMFIKRFIDLFGSIVGIVLISPLLIIVAIFIKATSKGPIFFKQERLGKDGKIFNILKFRTMIVNAEEVGDGIFVKTEKDSRITKIGKFLRATSIDELPQLLNVIAGEMSLVGPRPPLPEHPYLFNNYNNMQRKRFNMRPGMTGLTQVTVRNSVPWEERIKVDIEYVENFNVLIDFIILFKTIKKVFTRDSIYINNIKNETEETVIVTK